MSAEVASEIWGELRRYVNTVDRDKAEETLVQKKSATPLREMQISNVL
jgi:hypothetical protein